MKSIQKYLGIVVLLLLYSLPTHAQNCGENNDKIISRFYEYIETIYSGYSDARNCLLANKQILCCDTIGTLQYYDCLSFVDQCIPGKEQEAIDAFMQMLNIKSDLGFHDTTNVDIFIEIARLEQRIHNLDRAERFYQLANYYYPHSKRSNNKEYSLFLAEFGEFCYLTHRQLDALQLFTNAELWYRFSSFPDYKDLDYAKILSHIADVHMYFKNYPKALETYKESLSIYTEPKTWESYWQNKSKSSKFPINSNDSVRMHRDAIDFHIVMQENNIIRMYLELGNFHSADSLLLCMKQHLEDEYLYKEYEDYYGIYIDNLVNLKMKQGKYEEALDICESYLDIAYSKNCPINRTVFLYALILSFECNRTIPSVLQHIEQYNYQQNKQTVNQFFWQSQCVIDEELDQQRLAPIIHNTFVTEFDNYQKYSQVIYDNEIFWKGILLNIPTKRKEYVYNSQDSILTNQLQELQKVNTLLAIDTITEHVIEYKQYQVYLENEINQMVYSYLSNDYLNRTWKSVVTALDKTDMAIEFFQVPIWDGKYFTFNDMSYYAAIIRKGYKQPKIIKLCTESNVKQLLQNTFSGSSATQKFVTKLYSNGSPRFTNGDKLYELLWKPIEQELKGVKNVYFSPVGLLNSIAFNAISTNKTPISETYNLYQVSSTLEIERIKKGETKFNLQSATVYGGIEYEANQTDLIAASEQYGMPQERLYASRGIESSTERSGWYFLPGTKEESTWISNMLDSVNINTTCMQGYLANEESFKSLSDKSTDLIHIATHGFFLADEKKAAFNPFIQLQQEGQTNTEDAPSPMLRSGLLFAGANRAWTGTDVIEGIDDGILTAEEISQINLYGTKIVVLSACETGLGEMQTFEGVYGLQRAFKLAGVETLVMSLWKVDDAATKLLMQTFYSHWMNGKTKHDAFKTAIQMVKAQPQYASPYYWVGFIMVD